MLCVSGLLVVASLLAVVGARCLRLLRVVAVVGAAAVTRAGEEHALHPHAPPLEGFDDRLEHLQVAEAVFAAPVDEERRQQEHREAAIDLIGTEGDGEGEGSEEDE